MTTANQFDDPSVYFAASRGAATDWQFRGRAREELAAWTKSAVESIDWRREYCSVAAEKPIARAGWVGTLVLWNDCQHRNGNRHWEIVAVDEPGTAVVNLALTLPPKTPSEFADAVLRSWAVPAADVPSVKSYVRPKSYLPFPRPSWMQRQPVGPTSIRGSELRTPQ